MKSARAPALPETAEELQRIRAAMERGRFKEAAARCRTLVDRDASPDALALLGEIEYQRGAPDSAEPWLRQALAADRRHGRAHWLLGNISQDKGDLDAAITAYRRALRADAGFAEAHNDLGTAYLAKGWHAESEQCHRRALQLKPEDLPAMENLATVLRAQGKVREARDAFIGALRIRLAGLFGRFWHARKARAAPPEGQKGERELGLEKAKALMLAGKYGEAEPLLRKLVDANSQDADALHLLGGAAAESGRAADAIDYLERAIALRPSEPGYFVTLGNVLARQREFVRAIEAYQTALMLDPGNSGATSNIAGVLHDLGHFREAEEVHRVSMQQDPDIADAHSNFASTLISLGKFSEAQASARKALELNPKSIHAMTMLGIALIDQGRLEEAWAILRRAETAQPRNPLVLRWLGYCELILNADFKAAEAILRKAAAISPDDGSIHISLSRALLIQERFDEGWTEYEFRKQEASRARSYRRLPYPDWNGEPLKGKTIAVVSEQGLGDEIMFASCLQELASLGGSCLLYCSRRLEPLFRRSFPFARVVAGSHVSQDDPFPVLEGIDYQVAAGSLPRHFRRAAADFPAHHGYLKADERDIAKWQSRLSDLGPGMKIGLSWKGGTPLSDVTRRTMTLEMLSEVLALTGTRWISLQYGDSAAERQSFASRTGIVLHHWQEAVDDLDDTAALIAALDLRISVCNTQVHIAGALGKEVWVMAPLSPDWRYGYTGERMLWYPSVRMLRQKSFGNWESVVTEIRGRVEERIRSSC